LGRRARTLGREAVALGSVMLESAGRLMGLTFNAWLMLGGFVLFAIGNPVFAPSQPAYFLRSLTLNLDDSSIAAKHGCNRTACAAESCSFHSEWPILPDCEALFDSHRNLREQPACLPESKPIEQIAHESNNRDARYKSLHYVRRA
jgi:hypothetical protein